MRSTSRLAAVVAVVAVGVSAALAGCTADGAATADGAGDSATHRIVLADGAAKSSMASAVFLYAQRRGIFAEHGIDIEMTYVTPAAAQAALLAGDVDVAFDGDELMRAVAASGSGKVFMTSGALPFAIFADEALTVPELRGRTISSTTPGSSFSSALMKTLHDAGLDPDTDVEIVYLQTVAAQYAALQAGTVDAVLLSPPATVRARQDGFSKVADIADKTSPGVFAVSSDYLSADRAAVVAFVSAMAEATEAARGDLEDLTEVFAEANPEVGADLIAASIAEAAPLWEVSPYPRSWAETIMAASPNAELRSTPLTAFTDTTLVEQAGAVGPQAVP
ncbi:ABC transporter substrate-binding protein [Solwaraspora sp. WMMB335]|uniref:ABC transporter substrate-binding protein n=1 Tax=Solwaraspora sp. WMMB335 TaxID=3404118 RepID=UPI003B94A55A